MDSGVLRFVTAGSVDDGKSTLIGRLLFDSKAILSDQLEALSKAKHKRTEGDGIDLALLTDGLEAEREQGITIDVAYRYFSTPRKKFIIADTPGHEQYTRNMVTGASTADAIVILIDAVKFQKSGGLLLQTKRHSCLAHLLGIKDVVLAVNKMDLVGFDESVFKRIIDAYQEFASALGIQQFHSIPVSALLGENITRPSAQHMPWYTGPSLLTLLESLNTRNQEHAPFRFPVQWVARHGGTSAEDFRGYMGRVESGTVRVGDTLTSLPSGASTTVREIQTYDGALAEASMRQSVTLLFNDHVDVSRGDLLCKDTLPTVTKSFRAEVCWLSEEPLDLRHRYWLKHTTHQTLARVTAIESLLDVNTQTRVAGSVVKMNDIARMTVSTQAPVCVDPYSENRATGAFILIDEVTHQTAAAGMVLSPLLPE